MSIRRPNSVMNKYYRVLFKLPSNRVVFTSLLIIFIIMYFLLKTSSLIYITYFIFLIFTIIIYSKIYNMSVFGKIKRSIALSIVAIIYALLVSLFTNLLIGLVSSITIIIIAIQSLDGNNIYRYFVCIVPLYATILILYLFNIVTLRHCFFCIIGSIVLIIIDYLIYLLLSRYSVNGFKSVDLGTLYMWNWLEKRRDIESVFDSFGVNTVINPFLLKSSDTLVIYTDVHYGPFSNIGSSELPRRLTIFFRNKGFNTLVLHGVGSHERNFSHSKYIDSFIELLSNVLTENGFDEKYYGLFKLMNSEWDITGLVFTDISILLISRPYGGIDDLPYDLQILVNNISRYRNIGRVVLIDAHNWELESEFNKNTLENLLIESLNYIDLLKKNEPVDVFTRSICSIEKLPGVIDGDICLFELMGSDNRGHIVIIYLRGNNIVPGLRNELINYVKEKYGNVVVEVLTNDEHSETGIYAGSTYIPVQNSGGIFKIIDKLLDVLKQKNFSNKLFYIETSKEYSLIGNSVYKLVDLLERVYPVASIVLIGYVLLTPILLYILYYLLI